MPPDQQVAVSETEDQAGDVKGQVKFVHPEICDLS